MNLEKLSHSSAIAILESLLSTGQIVEGDLATALINNPSTEMKRVTDLVHSSMCHDVHSEKPNDCHYYLEESQGNTWGLPTHQEWLTNTTTLMSDLKIFSEGELLFAFSHIQPFLQMVARMEHEEPEALALALRVLGWSV